MYGLNVSHYVFLTLCAYDAFLKTSGVELDCPNERELFFLVKRNIWGGFVTKVKPYMAANNPVMNPSFHPDTTNGKYIFYLDINSLYGSTMCDYLSMGNITKLTPEEINVFLEIGISNHATDDSVRISYWLHMDSKAASPSVARLTDEFPPCLTYLNIAESHLSPYSRQLLQEEGRKLPKSNSKLIVS